MFTVGLETNKSPEIFTYEQCFKLVLDINHLTVVIVGF